MRRSSWWLRRRLQARTLRCPICQLEGTPLFRFPDPVRTAFLGVAMLRDDLTCRGCGAIMRARALSLGLLEAVEAAGGGCHADIPALASSSCVLRILDTDHLSPLAQRLQSLPNFRRSCFRPDFPFGGEIEPRVWNLDLRHLGLPAASLDIVLTSDVLEHVDDDGRALAEIHRVLAPGGMHVFTVPFDQARATTRVLIQPTGDGDVPLEPPHYHGDPLSENGILSYRIYGRDLLQRLADIGFDPGFRAVVDARAGVWRSDLFISRRGG